MQEPRSSVRFRNEFNKIKHNNFKHIIESSTLVSDAVVWLKEQDVLSTIEYSVPTLPNEIARFYYQLMLFRYKCIICNEDFDTVFRKFNNAKYKIPRSVKELCTPLLI